MRKNSLYKLYLKVVKAEGTPECIARGVAVGLTVGLILPIGFQTLPALALAWEALRGQRGACAVLNAANEEAVAAFLQQRIRFDQIYAAVRATLDATDPGNPHDLPALLALHDKARAAAQEQIAKLEK